MMRSVARGLWAIALAVITAHASPIVREAAAAQRTADARTGHPSFDEVTTWVNEYRLAHSGNGGKDWDINAKSTAQLATDAAARRLLGICGPDQRPIIPLLAWEYGGADHRWINPSGSALVYCVYIPVRRSSAHWRFETGRNRVIADVYVLFPDQNPCRNRTGRDQVAACIGDDSNFEILVDTASLNDGNDVGLKLAEASTQLMLVLADGGKVQLAVD